jgi:NAD(P)-dependent dehydrogenase (short-subunit alcohol dehydrogenase family)
MTEEFGRVDVLVNNAGIMTKPAPVWEYEVSKWDYTLAVNLRGTFLMTKAILPMMTREKRGSIINVSSTIGRGCRHQVDRLPRRQAGIGDRCFRFPRCRRIPQR